MKPTTYIEFTAEGGRIGRLAWWNGDEELWGGCSWDPWWPGEKPRPSALVAAVTAAAAKLADACRAMAPAFAAAAATLQERFPTVPVIEGEGEK